MSNAIDNLNTAMKRATAIRPRVGGFPYLAECLRQAGVVRNIWSLPACQSLFVTRTGPVVIQGAPLVSGAVDVPGFDQGALVTALRIDQAGNSTFPEFLEAAWRAGIVRYDVDFTARSVTYLGCNGETYTEAYPAVQIDDSHSGDALAGDSSQNLHNKVPAAGNRPTPGTGRAV